MKQIPFSVSLCESRALGPLERIFISSLRSVATDLSCLNLMVIDDVENRESRYWDLLPLPSQSFIPITIITYLNAILLGPIRPLVSSIIILSILSLVVLIGFLVRGNENQLKRLVFTVVCYLPPLLFSLIMLLVQ